jgi:6-phosphogluconolactonase (cycloisomerase 2 family)
MYAKQFMSGLCAAAVLLGSLPFVSADQIEAVYTMSNAVSGNEVLVFHRRPKGNLEAAGAFATGGNGTGGGLENQSAVVLDPSDRWLFVVNAGSGSISSFRVLENSLKLVDTEPSGGFRPISLTVFGTWVYVLNEGDVNDPASEDNIAGFRFNADGTLSPIPNATHRLSARITDPAQISFNKEGTVLLVTEKATNTITTYTVDADGIPSGPITRPSAFPTPFGFQFGDRDFVFISEVNAGGPGSVVSYRVGRETGMVSSAIDVFAAENAVCWVVLSNDQTIGYATNTGSASISLFEVNFDGTMDSVLPGGNTVSTGNGPLDLVLTQDGRYLYTLNFGDDTIRAFRVRPNGRLRRLGTVETPDGANGLAAR